MHVVHAWLVQVCRCFGAGSICRWLCVSFPQLVTSMFYDFRIEIKFHVISWNKLQASVVSSALRLAMWSLEFAHVCMLAHVGVECISCCTFQGWCLWYPPQCFFTERPMWIVCTCVLLVSLCPGYECEATILAMC